MSGIDIGPKISIEGEKEFKDAIKAINSQIKASTSEIKALSAEYDKNRNTVQNLTKRQNALRDGVSAAQSKVKALTSEYGRQTGKLVELDKSLKEAKEKFAANSEEVLKAENAYSKQAQAVSDLEGKISTAKGQVANLNSQLEDNTQKLEEARSKAVKFGDAWEKAGDKITKLGGGLSKTGGALSLAITAPTVTAGSAAVKLATDAETSFAKVETIADTSVKKMDAIRSGVMRVSSETGEAVTDFNEALYQTISATGDTQNAIDYTTIAVKAAKGGFTDTATAVNGLTTIMNSYGLKGAEAMEEVSDQMLIAQNYGKTTFGELAASMGQVVPIAAQLDIGTDTLLATMAALTKNGIGTSQAVTGLKAALSNIIKPSTEASKAADALGLDFSAAALQSKGLVGFMGDVKAALSDASPQYAKLSENLDILYEEMANLEAAGQKSSEQYKNLKKAAKSTEEEMKTLAGAADSPIAGFSTLFGSVEGLNSMLVLASKTGGKDLQGAMDAMKNSAGATQEAFDKMNSTPAAQMNIELNKLKNTGIETGAKLLPVITKIVNSAGDILDQYNALDDAKKNMIIRNVGIAAAVGPVMKLAGTAVSGIGKITSGVGGLAKDLGKLKAAKKAAEEVGKLGSEAIKSAEGVSGLPKILATLGPKGLAVGGVVAGAAAIGTALWKIREDAINADIASQFGKITLSAEEVEDIATRLTTTDWTMKIDTVMEAKEDMAQAEADIKNAIEQMNKLAWKVEVGLELTEGEEDSYKTAIDDYIKGAQDYVSNSGYAVELALNATFDPDGPTGEGLSAFASDFYNSAYKELEDLGKSLAESVNLSFEYNTFGENMHVDQIISQMNDVISQIEEAEHLARLNNMEIELSADNIGINKESFDRLNQQIAEYTQANLEGAEETRITLLTSVNLQYQEMLDAGFSKEFARKVKEDAQKEIESAFQSQQADVISIGLNFAFDNLPQGYRDQLDKSAVYIDQYTEEFANTVAKTLEETGSLTNLSFNEFWLNAPAQLSKDAKRTVSDMLESLAPQKEALQNIANRCMEAGVLVPQSITEGLSDIAQWEAAAGEASGMYALLAEELANDPKKREALFAQEEFGRSIPEELAQAITTYTGYAYDAATGMWEKVSEANQLSAEEVAEELNRNGADHGNAYAQALASQYGLVYEKGKWLVDQAAQGAKDNEGQFEVAGRSGGRLYVDSAGNVTSGATLPAPKVAELDVSPVTSAMEKLSARDWSIPVRLAAFYAGSDVKPYAHGGIIDQPIVAMAGEDGPEAIIPLSPKYRENAFALLDETARRINAESFDFVLNASRDMGARNREQTVRGGAQNTYRIEKGSINININTTGGDPEALAEALEERVMQNVERRRAAYGR